MHIGACVADNITHLACGEVIQLPIPAHPSVAHDARYPFALTLSRGCAVTAAPYLGRQQATLREMIICDRKCQRTKETIICVAPQNGGRSVEKCGPLMQACASAGMRCKDAGRGPRRALSLAACVTLGRECASWSASRATSAACWAQSRTAAARCTARCRRHCFATASTPSHAGPLTEGQGHALNDWSAVVKWVRGGPFDRLSWPVCTTLFLCPFAHWDHFS